MTRTKQGRHQTSILVGLLTLTVVVTMVYSSYIGRNMAERYAPLIDASMEIKLEATMAHLWFEELISGDKALQIEGVWKHIDQAEWYAHAMLEGGENKEGHFFALNDPDLRDQIEQTLVGLDAFREAANERWSQQGQSAIGSEMDQHFDAIFLDFIASADRVETALQRVMSEQLQHFRLVQNMLILVIIILGGMIGLVLYRHDRKHVVDLQALHNSEENLRITLRSIGDAVITTDQKGNVVQMNPVAEQLTGWSLDEARGISLKIVFPIIDASTREVIQNPVDKVIETGVTVYLSNHTTLIAKDGTEYQIADSAAPIRNDDRDILGMVLVFNDVTEQYLLRENLLDERRVLRGIVDAIPDLMFLKNADGVYLRCNKAFEKFLGVTEKEIIGRTDFDLMEAGVAEFFRAKDQVVMESGFSQVNEETVTYPDGHKVLLETLKMPFDGASGGVPGLLGLSRDITQQRQLENEAYSSMQHLKLYREQTPLAAIEWNTAFQVVDWNEAAEAMFGYRLDEVQGRYFVDIMLPENAVMDVEEVWRGLMAQTGGTVSINENITKEGRTILCEWHNTALVDESGEVIGAASLVLDVTDERKAKQALEQQAKEQLEILNTLSDGVITICEKGIILSYNKAAEMLFGYPFDEAMGQNISLLMPEPDKSRHDGYINKYLTSGEKQSLLGSREVVGQNKNRTTFPMRLMIRELPVLANGKRRFIGSCQDLTQLKVQQAQLQRTQKMDALGKLVGGIAHDYNNMLGVILGYTDLMEMKYGNVEGLQKYIDNIAQAGERGRKLTRRMLAFSKQESTHAQAVSVHDLLAAQKELLSKSVTARIKIDYKQCESPWLIWIDPSELEDALLNLTINAQSAMPDGGVLTFITDTIRLSGSEAELLGLSENDYLKLSVSDTGCGIADEIKHKVFDPFFSTKGAGGTGLGLSQVYGFMERAGGAVKLYSQVGIGSELTLYFPRYQGGAGQAPEEGLLVKGQQGDGEIILVVDDEPALRELAQELLTLAGYRVLLANDGEAALAVLLANHIDLVLSDVIMPNMDGYQLAQQIGEHYPEVKIQLASGFSDNRHRAMEDSQLHKMMLHKPYSASKLLERMAQLLSEGENGKN